VDLSRIDRALRKELAYQTKPKYCLLVFGPEAKTRVWLVLDGGRLYMDRNGNGDLTEAGERVDAMKGDGTSPEDGVFYFEAGDIPDGTLTHKNLRLSVMKLDYLAQRDDAVKGLLAKEPQFRGYTLGVDVALPGWKGAGLGGRVEQAVFFRDVHGFLRFADKPQDAPVVHFGGPWQVTLFERPEVLTGREADIYLAVGTPGRGPGTSAYVNYEGVIPPTAYPKVQISYPPKVAGEPPLRELYELKQRC
jgi:hypothetical protein